MEVFYCRNLKMSCLEILKTIQSNKGTTFFFLLLSLTVFFCKKIIISTNIFEIAKFNSKK